MKQIKSLISLLAIFSFILIFFGSVNQVSAACNQAAYCDAPPGQCSTTSNGGQTIVIGTFTPVERKCSNSVMQICDYCSSQDLQDNPYCQPECQPVEECRNVPGDTVVITECVDTVWQSCCTPGGAAGSCGDGVCSSAESCSSCTSDCGACVSQWCGDGTCNNGESCGSCAADCGSCPAVCGDGSCGYGEGCDNCSADCGSCPGASCGNGSCESGEGCGNCPVDCGACSTQGSCGNGVCGSGENCSNCSSDCGTCVSCGDGVCNGSENCSTCATDCGSCASNFCGDTQCNGFETCSTCSADCGACADNLPWFQISAGHVGSANDGNASVAIQSEVPDLAECVAPDCVRSALREDLDSTDLTDGFSLAGSGTIDFNGGYNERAENVYVSNTTKSRYQEKYEFFYRNSGLGNNPSSHFIGQEGDAQKPTYDSENIAYYHEGDITIQSPWSVSAGETYVIFIEGNLTLTDGDGSSDQLINVEEGGFLAFIVSGNIIINESLGNATLTDTTSNVEGVFIADGTLTVESRGTAAGGDDRFVAEGSYIGWSGVNLDRDFSDGATRSTENTNKPIELFIYRPDFLVNMPDIMLVPIRIWQETN
jgi:hypothetical protein